MEKTTTSYMEIKKSKEYSVFRNEDCFLGQILILDKTDIVFNPYKEISTLDFSIQEMEDILSIMKSKQRENK